MMTRLTRIPLLLTLFAALIGCTPTIIGLESKTERPWRNTYFYSHALSAIPVFNNDVETFTSYWGTRYGVPKKSYRFGENSGRLIRPDSDNTTDAIKDLAKRAKGKKDLIIVMLASEGAQDALMIQPVRSSATRYSARRLKRFLSPLNKHPQLIVIQACHSGTLIDNLAHKNRIIIVSDAVGGKQGPCLPTGSLSPFTEYFVDSMQGAGQLKEVYERARVNLTQHSSSIPYPLRIHASPDVYVGENMTEFWTGEKPKKSWAFWK